MLFSTALPVSAYTSKDLASDEKTDTPYYANYTFDQFYALPDAELEQIFEECDTYHENIQFRCAYATLEQCDAMVEKYGDSAEVQILPRWMPFVRNWAFPEICGCGSVSSFSG